MPKRKLNNVTKRSDGRWMARETFGYNLDGSPNRKTFYGKTAEEAHKKMDTYSRQVENGLNVDAENITFAQWLTLWMAEYKLNVLRPHTFDTYEDFVKNHISPALGRHKLMKLRPEHLQTFINGLTRKDNEPMSSSGVKQIKTIMSGALSQAVKNGLITRNPADALSLPKSRTKRKVGAFTQSEQMALLDQLSDHRLYGLFVTALGTGARIGEILALRWMEVDLVNNEMSVIRAVSRSKDRDVSTEGGKPKSSLKVSEPKTEAGNRTIPLTREIQNALVKHRDDQLTDRKNAGDAWTDNGLVFCTALGDLLEPRNVTRLYHKQRAIAGIPNLPFHSLRHTFATNAITADMDYYYLSRIMGHANISITLDTYADYMPDKSRSEMGKLEGVLQIKIV